MANCCPLPDDLIIEILLRLPVRSLLTFKSICHEWNTIISSPRFVSMKFDHKPYLLLYRSGHQLYKRKSVIKGAFSVFSNETLEKQEVPQIFKSLKTNAIALYVPCNGIFCVVNFRYKIGLWNPATRRLKLVPSPLLLYRSVLDLGFGIDPLTNELKIVLLIQSGEEVFSSYFFIYTSVDNSWRQLEAKILSSFGVLASWRYSSREHSIFLKGFCYWMNNKNSTRLQFFSFDMHNETFEEIKVPADLKGVQGKIALNNDSLALFAMCGDIQAAENEKCVGIWLMKKKGCWVKLFNMVLPFRTWKPPLLVGFWNGKVVYVADAEPHDPTRTESLILYDPNSKNPRTTIQLLEKDFGPFEVVLAVYKETIHSVGTKKCSMPESNWGLQRNWIEKKKDSNESVTGSGLGVDCYGIQSQESLEFFWV